VGTAEGRALLGDAEGCGVGLPGVYVGTRVGDAVGAALGEALGWGVGAPTDVNTNESVDPVAVVAIAASLRMTVERPDDTVPTATTVTVDVEGSTVDETVLPTVT
jgi:hypothetical protein